MNEEIASWKAKGHGTYDIITQSDFLPTLTTSQLAVVHFFHRDFERCKVVGKHLSLIAPRYLPVKICSIDAEKTPFFVDKLKIAVLPTVVFFKDGKVVDRFTGFADFNNSDNFTTEEMEQRMKKSGIMKQLKCHQSVEDRLAEDERRNQSGGVVFTNGTNHGFSADVDGDEFED